MPPITLNNRYQYNPDTDLLGAGGIGMVYKAYDKEHDRYVAIKKFSVTNESLKYSLKNEFQRSINFSHGNLVRSYDFFSTTYTLPTGETHETQYGVMELIEGGDLASYLQTRPPLPELLEVVKGILRGLDYLHSPDPNTNKGVIIHRDIKPANILIFRNNEGKPIPKIADFNIAKEASKDLSTQTIVGTPEYMSPEQFMPKQYGANGKLLPNTDLWSLGVLLCDHLLQKSTFGKRSTGQAQGEIMDNVLRQALPTNAIQNLPAPFNQIIAACLVRHATQRIQSAKELLQILETPPPPFPPVPPPPIENGEGTTIIIDTPPTIKLPDPRIEEPPLPRQPEGKDKWVIIGAIAFIIILAYLYNAYTSYRVAASFAEQMVTIEGGTFTMGSPESEADRQDNEQQHPVTLSTFSISKYEVTQAQWEAIMSNNPSDFKGDNLPVETVSWDDVQEFLTKLNAKFPPLGGKGGYRLPTEAEWEYAARGGTTTPFNTGNCLSTDQANYYGDYPYQNCAKGQYPYKTTPVGSFVPNQYGLYDMHGNVWEWCNDWYDENYYSNSPANNPTGPITGAHRVLRGGSWGSYAQYCRVAYRNGNDLDNRRNFYGFRLALVP